MSATTTPPSSSSSEKRKDSGTSDRHEGDPLTFSLNNSAQRSSPTASSLPKITLFKRGLAWNSPQVDERCFIYCKQTSRGRARIENPECRTICFRKIFGHEVSDGSYDTANDVNATLKPRRPIPLPGEGQHPDAVSDGEVEENEKTQNWKEGLYIWTAKGGRWITHEKVDTMVLPLTEQAKWMRHKEALVRMQRETERTGVPSPLRIRKRDEPEVEWEQPARFVIPTRAIQDSLLLRITPISSLLQETIHQRLSFILSPTYKVLEVFQRSILDGTQKRLFHKAIEQATNGSTLTLLRNVWDRHEMLWKKIEQENKEDDRKKKDREVKDGEKEM
ncbi:hypothetical protein Clacol_002674 [Clathrus columnatus]|uniref:Uncharacterized protein n=1 Tax=Clathrus columnatus TaxID=1419009 RepID=A0AAV5A623_9AGAM|nr:hypothetical protein Clacol_002674 [Clathrus columnatus]